jgi:hypothetical protein
MSNDGFMAKAKRLIGGGRTSAFRKWSRHTRERARCGDERSLRRIARGAAGARAQLADMRKDAQIFAEVGLTRGTIIRLEKNPSAVQPRTVRDVRKLYEARGIQFLFRDDGVGIGISKNPPE